MDAVITQKFRVSSNEFDDFEADSLEEAEDEGHRKARNSCLLGLELYPIFYSFDVESPDGDSTRYPWVVNPSPDSFPCAEDLHEFQTMYRNGSKAKERCVHCGLLVSYDYDAINPDTGESGFETVQIDDSEYKKPEAESGNW